MKNWYEQTFEDIGEDFEIIFAGQMPRTRAQVEFAIQALRLAPGARVLDIACGVGRHSIELARRGYHVTGLDLSPTLLKIAAERAERAGVQVNWVRADMRQIPFSQEFDAAFNIFSSWGYLETEEEDQKVLASVARALKPGGALLLETAHRDWLIRHFQARSWSEGIGVLVMEERVLDLLSSRLLDTWTAIYEDGRQRRWQINTRLYTAAELRRMLESAGFRLSQSFGGYDGAPLTLESSRLILVGELPTP
jgi:ubiquinone/menaquinone biosynthesis C-methylase UbiE